MGFLDRVIARMADPELRAKAAFFEGVPLFEGLDRGELGRLAPLVYSKTYRSGETIFEEHDLARAFYLLKRGEVEVVKTLEGKAAVLARLGPGALFGEMALLAETPRLATLRAATDCEAYILYKADFDAFIARYPRIGNRIIMNLVRMLIQRIGQTSDRYMAEILAKRWGGAATGSQQKGGAAS